MIAGKIFWPVAAGLLAVMGVVQVTSARMESQTYDESTHLAAGYSYLMTGDYRLNHEHPALGKILNALPLLPLKPLLPLDDPAWAAGYGEGFGRTFMFHNRVPAETLLFRGRCVTIFFTLVLGLLLALWTRQQFGPGAALFALLLYCFDPNIIAHGRYITTDLFVTLAMFLACIAWGAYLESGKSKNLIWAGLAAGLTLLAKFSGPILFVFFVVLYGIKWLQQRKALSFWHLCRSMLVVGAISAGMIVVCYAPEVVRFATADKAHFVPLTQKIQHRSVTGRTLYLAGEWLHLPAYTYLVGLESAAGHVRIGHPAYLLGKVSQTGWWYYFPVAFAVKTPTAVLLLALLCLLVVVVSAFQAPRRLAPVRIREARFAWFVLMVPIGVYGGISLLASMNIGLRHILPIYPFLLVLLSAIIWSAPPGAWRRALPIIIGVLAIGEIVESARIYPDYLAFFNVLSGGPAKGPDYLVDSNIDWGQDAKKLKQWWERQNRPPLCLAYFGLPDVVEYYGIPASSLHATQDCVGAISVTYLKGVYRDPNEFKWVRGLSPMGRVGYSIYLYDLRKHPVAAGQ